MKPPAASLIIAICLCFCSCGLIHSVEFEKRIYRKGFYFHRDRTLPSRRNTVRYNPDKQITIDGFALPGPANEKCAITIPAKTPADILIKKPSGSLNGKTTKQLPIPLAHPGHNFHLHAVRGDKAAVEDWILSIICCFLLPFFSILVYAFAYNNDSKYTKVLQGLSFLWFFAWITAIILFFFILPLAVILYSCLVAVSFVFMFLNKSYD
ncbi:MAG TPA: hypothetical protein VFU15_01445 [Bacteroidia bacterium]|nr:hypothetical protein [Bacteroidia bacterium]